MSNYAKAIIYILVWAFFLTTNNIFVQLTSVDAFGDVFWRNLFCCLMLLPAMLLKGGGETFILERKFWRRFFFRSLTGIASMVFLYVSLDLVSDINFSTVQFIFNAGPLFSLMLAVIFLKERVRASQLISFLLAIAGMVVILNPKADTYELALVYSLISATLSSFSTIFMRLLKGVKNALSVVFYFCLLSTLVGLFFQIYQGWQNPASVLDLIYMLISGLHGILIVYLITLGYRYADVSKVGVYGYSSFVFALLAQMVYKGTTPALSALFGAALIVAAGVLNYFVARKATA